MQVTQNTRIEVLDAYRFLAIISVILFHFYSRYTIPISQTNIYPYGRNYNYFQYGNLGVFFFFIISGFVIASSLQTTNSFRDFWIKRFFRLFPLMLICSLTTFVIVSLFDNNIIFPASHSPLNFIFSLSFLTPEFFKKFSININYINGSYWSLWPEIQFYFIASSVYFISKINFVRNFILLTILGCSFNYLITVLLLYNQNTNHSINFLIYNYKELIGVFNYIEHSLFFSIGVVLYQLYLNKKRGINLFVLLILVALLLISKDAFAFTRIKVYHSVFIMIFAFLSFIYLPRLTNLFTIKPFTTIGLASYPIYLIHENIGVLMIHKYGGLWGKYDFLFPILVFVLIFLFSVFVIKYIEKPIVDFLKKIVYIKK